MKETTKIRNFDRRITGSSVIDENLNEVSIYYKVLEISIFHNMYSASKVIYSVYQEFKCVLIYLTFVGVYVLIVHCLDSIIPLVSISKISSLCSCLTDHAGFCLAR